MTPFAGLARRAARRVLFRAFDADRLLRGARRRGARRFAFAWVRGVGDVAFILNEFVRHVRRAVPGAEVTALVRPGLAAACRWIPELHDVIAVEEWSREHTVTSPWDLAFPPPWEIRRALARRGRAADVDAILPYPLGRWYERDAAARRPSLRWSEAERAFGVEFLRRVVPDPAAFVVALNAQTGTARYYDHVKEWGAENVGRLVAEVLARRPDAWIVAVDAERDVPLPSHPRVVDARGTLSLPECVSVAVAADVFVGLDTGPANLAYFLEGVTADLVVLLGRRAVFTPLRHPPASAGVRLTALVGEGDDVRRIAPETVLAALAERWSRRAEAAP